MQLIEGYGQTESGSVSTITLLNDVSANHVGCPLVSMYYKLQDVPEMDYYAKDCQGEVSQGAILKIHCPGLVLKTTGFGAHNVCLLDQRSDKSGCHTLDSLCRARIEDHWVWSS